MTLEITGQTRTIFLISFVVADPTRRRGTQHGHRADRECQSHQSPSQGVHHRRWEDDERENVTGLRQDHRDPTHCGNAASESQTHQDRAENVADHEEQCAHPGKPLRPHRVDERRSSIPLLHRQLGRGEVHAVQCGQRKSAQVGGEVHPERDHGEHRPATSGQPSGRQKRGNNGQHGDEAEQCKRELSTRVGRDQVQCPSSIAVVGQKQSANGDRRPWDQQDHGRDNALEPSDVSDLVWAGGACARGAESCGHHGPPFGIRMPSRIRSIQRPPRRLRLCPESLAMEPGNVPTPVGPGPQTLRLIRFIIET